jgi:hypothetical protein
MHIGKYANSNKNYDINLLSLPDIEKLAETKKKQILPKINNSATIKSLLLPQLLYYHLLEI